MITTQWMAESEDKNNDIACGWAIGDRTAFDSAKNKYTIDKSIAEAILENDGIATPSDVSDYGGGSECCDWYNCNNLIIGIASCGICWAIPIDADIPGISDYVMNCEYLED